jgi:uncharacterized protein (TIGR02466 family)
MSTETIINLFPTPVYVNQVANFDKIQSELGQCYDDLVTNNRFQRPATWDQHTQVISDPTFGSNILEDYDLAAFKTELVTHVSNYIKAMKSDIGYRRPGNFTVKNAWIAVTNSGEFGHLHTHADADLSGVYYYQTTGKDGSFYIDNPNKVLMAGYCTHHLERRVMITPEPGKIILFPGWLEHGVASNQTKDTRISVSFNIYFERA